jgi:catechol 2,3-dioxygenase-like lactoylglutathione lyase family enzyme
MFDHVGLRVKDVDVSVRFYKAVLAPLGSVLDAQEKEWAGLGPKGAPALWLYATDRKATSAGTHVCFAAPDRAAVERFHAAGVEAGGSDNGKPGVREDYGAKYYAAFLIDPDGNNVEAVFNR